MTSSYAFYLFQGFAVSRSGSSLFFLHANGRTIGNGQEMGCFCETGRGATKQVAGWVGKPVQLYINEQLGPMVKLPSSVSYYSFFFSYDLQFVRFHSLSLSLCFSFINSFFVSLALACISFNTSIRALWTKLGMGIFCSCFF